MDPESSSRRQVSFFSKPQEFQSTPFSTFVTRGTINDRFKTVQAQQSQNLGMLGLGGRGISGTAPATTAVGSRLGLLSQIMDLDNEIGNSPFQHHQIQMAETRSTTTPSTTLMELLGSGNQGLATAYDLKEMITRQQIIAEAEVKTKMMEFHAKTEVNQNLILQQLALLASASPSLATASALNLTQCQPTMDARAFISNQNSFLDRCGRFGGQHNRQFGHNLNIGNGRGGRQRPRNNKNHRQRKPYNTNPSKCSVAKGQGISPLKRLGTTTNSSQPKKDQGGNQPKFVADKYTGTKWNTKLPSKETLDDDLDVYMAQVKKSRAKEGSEGMMDGSNVSRQDDDELESTTVGENNIVKAFQGGNHHEFDIIGPTVEYELEELSDRELDDEDGEERELTIDESAGMAY